MDFNNLTPFLTLFFWNTGNISNLAGVLNVIFSGRTVAHCSLLHKRALTHLEHVRRYAI